MTDDATLSAGLRDLARSLEDFVDAETCAMLQRAAKRIDDMHAEILHIRIYAPGLHQAHEIRMAPHVGPTDFAFYGLPVETDFDTFGHPVPNESEL